MIMDFFDDSDNIFSSIFNKFNRPVRDQSPYCIYKADGKGFIVVCNTLGIDKNDISVNIEKNKGRGYPSLRVKGSTEIEKIKFQNSVDLAILLRLDEQIEDVSYEVKNGLTIVYIKVKINEEEKITAKCIDDDASLDW